MSSTGGGSPRQEARPYIELRLGACREAVEKALQELEAGRVIPRIWEQDHTVWKPEPEDIANRLGWLGIARESQKNLAELTGFAAEVRSAGYLQVVLLGMGGSSLAPEVFARTFGAAPGFLDLAVVDSTDPGLILDWAGSLDPARTLFIVATKSGGTVETLSQFKFFYNWLSDALGPREAGRHFAAITDPGSTLADLAREHGFRRTFLNDPNIGGRYSVLSHFGLVPAALLGIDLPLLLERALQAAAACRAEAGSANPAALLGAALAALAQAGRDKLTLLCSPALASFGDWLEQLVAESTGKEGRGILPVIGEPAGPPQVYGPDRLFVHLRLEGDDSLASGLQTLQEAGHPLVRLNLADLYDLGAQFFLWEMATAVAGHLLRINPFDQPDVESAKVRAREMVAAYSRSGSLPEDLAAELSSEALEDFLSRGNPGDYLAIQAYLKPEEEMSALLQRLRTGLRDSLRLATTVGYGPRFLHSTGQLHKGDAGRGLFVQLTADIPRDAAIPDRAGQPGSAMSFGTLKMAQALGDKRALEDKGRRVIRFHLGGSPAEALKGLLPLQEQP